MNKRIIKEHCCKRHLFDSRWTKFKKTFNLVYSHTENKAKYYIFCLLKKENINIMYSNFNWLCYKKRYNKQYYDAENVKRKQIYEQNKQIIEDHNSNKNTSFVMYIDKFTDLDDFEWEWYKKRYNKQYYDAENVKRKQIYEQNKQIIEDHNSNKNTSFVMYIDETTDLDDFEWIWYKRRYNKQYSDDVEDLKRKQIYEQNKINIEINNSNKNTSFIMGIDETTDLDDFEISNMILSLILGID